MRCRKVRSLLSAACSDELDARQHASVREHVADCPSCKREYAYYSSIREAGREISDAPVSDDFNARLLNRIAEERFAETRTKAYLPKRAPQFQWRSLVPVAVVAGLLAVVTLNVYQPEPPVSTVGRTASALSHMDDAYLTAQPSGNPNVTVAMEDSWTLNQKLARTERLDQISRRLTSNRMFMNQLTGGTRVPGLGLVPVQGRYLQMPRITYRIYWVGVPGGSGEGGQAY